MLSRRKVATSGGFPWRVASNRSKRGAASSPSRSQVASGRATTKTARSARTAGNVSMRNEDRNQPLSKANAECSRRVEARERAHGEASHPFDFRWDGVESKSAIRYGPEIRHVLDNRDPGAEQDGVRWSSPVLVVIDVERVDPDQRGTGAAELLGGIARQKGMLTTRVPVRAPMQVPSGMNQDRLASHRQRGEPGRIERTAITFCCTDDQRRNIRDGVERVARDVVAIRISVEGCVDIRAGIGEQVDLANLKCRPDCVADG